MKTLRVVFCLLSCLCLAACVLVFVYFSYWGFVCLGGAVLFGLLMLGAKNGFRRTPKPEKTDYMNSEEENERIRRESDEAEKRED